MDPSFAFLGIDPYMAFAEISPLLPPDYRALAVEHGQVMTHFGNAKITNADDLLRFLFAYTGGNQTLRQVVAELAALGAPKLSAMRLHMRLRQAAPYLEVLCRRMLEERADLVPESWRGLELVHAASMTAVALATQTQVRLHIATTLASARVDALATTDPSDLDSVKQFFWLPKQVIVASAEAATGASIMRATTQGAHVLLELGEGPMPLAFVDGYGGPVDARAFALGLRESDGVLARPVRLAGEPKVRIDGRLVAFMRGGVRAVFFTTVPTTLLPREDVPDVTERAARVASALSGWRRSGARLSIQRDDTTRGWVYARMLLGLLEQKIADGA